jgi:8-oxo-dGTP diphosphatase
MPAAHGGQASDLRPLSPEAGDIPGGYVEPGESPAAACRRELNEELGLDRVPGRLLLVDWAPHPAEGDKLLFVFDGGTLTDASEASPDGVEIAQTRFVATTDVNSLMPPRLVRRITTAAAKPLNSYAENGESLS